MKHQLLHLFLVILFNVTTALGQVPQGVNFQGVAQDASGLALQQGTVIGLKLSVLQGSATGSTVYSEEHSSVTLEIGGIFNVVMGKGTVLSGTFSGINWQTGSKFLKIEMRQGAGTYSTLSTTEIMSVPYAQTSGNGIASVAINPQGQLFFTASNGATINAGKVVGPQGTPGIGLTNGSAVNQMAYWNGNAWVTLPAPTKSGSVLTFCNGTLVWAVGGQCPGTLGALNCGAATTVGTLTSGTAASGISSSIPYTGGNGGIHNGQMVTSTGVTGLTATLTAGTLATGVGSLLYTITGTPSAAGTARFAISLGGKSCTLTIIVNSPIAAIFNPINCTSAFNTGTLISGVTASGIGSTIPYTGGNGGIHNGQSVTSTGVTGLTATLSAGTLATGAGSLTYTITGTPSSSGTASFAISLGGQSCTLTRMVGVPANILTALNCASATNSGVLSSNTVASGVSSSIPYIDGNGGAYSGQTVTSTGVTGLTATLSAGTLASGAGSLTYIITGTPSAAGTANFAISLGGQSCILTRLVNGSSSPTYPPGTVHCGGTPTAVVEVTNPATGKVWMDRNLGASRVATSRTDSLAYGDLYQWGRRADGHQCRTSTTTNILSSSDQPAHGNFILTSISPLDWRSPQNENLWQGINGVNNPCPSGYRLPTEIELHEERSSWGIYQDATGAFSSPLKLPLAGSRELISGLLLGTGNLGYYWSCTISTIFSSTLFFGNGNSSMFQRFRVSGHSVRCLKEITPLQGTINTINCNSATTNGTLNAGTAASGISCSIPYIGGNAGAHNGQTLTSTGVMGLTATLAAGTLVVGAGSLTYTITGTPISSGTAQFAVSIGGQSCTLNISVIGPQPTYPAGTVHCNGIPTLVFDVTNHTTGRSWMDRNLGANRAATSSTDTLAYGDLYQWGRRADGHQCRTSTTTNTLSSTDQPAHGNFILAPNTPFDWRSPQNNTLWQGVNGINNPCPSGYRLPTESELSAERTSWSSNNSAGAFASPLKLPLSGWRNNSNGSFIVTGAYWSSKAVTNSIALGFDNSNAGMGANRQAGGHSVRCIKDNAMLQGAIITIDCNTATNTGLITAGIATSGVSSSITYTGGNGGNHNGQTVTSTGVTGLTATLSAGILASGAGSLTYVITGTPTSVGIANFAINLGGQSCTLSRVVNDTLNPTYLPGTVHCGGIPTAVVEVTNPATGKVWMDRNLGASRAATSSTDSLAYGDLYQWGRRADGHQCRTSNTTITLSSIDQPAHGNFILAYVTPGDWRSPQNDNLWQGVNGVNNPCPSGYRLPTDTELNAERLTWSSNNAAGAFASILKLPLAGLRGSNGSVLNDDASGDYWSSNVSLSGSTILSFGSSYATMGSTDRALGFSVRCLKNIPPRQGAINSIDCSNATNTGVLTSGFTASGIRSNIPYTGGNGGIHNGQTVTSTGVTGLTATLSAGTLATGAGSLTYTITGTPNSSGTASFAISLGGQSCTLTRMVSSPVGTLVALNCASATNTGVLISGTVASGISSSIPYIGGNGGTHNGQTVTSTGVTGLTATLLAGTLATGAGSLPYTITGTPSAAGTANFAISVGGQSCLLTRVVNATSSPTFPPGTVHCGGTPTAVVEVTSPATGKVWMDRNLGASRAATGSTDSLAYGDLYQWGRRADGHQCRTSTNTNTLSSTDQPAHGSFITSNTGNYDWRSPQNDILWQGINGINNPCPSGYRLPTEIELDAERSSWGINQNAAGAFASPLKLLMAGNRNILDGSIFSVGYRGNYWSSNVNTNLSSNLHFNNINSSIYPTFRAHGYSVRCLKENTPLQGNINTIDCNSATTNGTLNSGVVASGVSSSIPYTGGDGGIHNGQIVTSTGVTGLTATLTAGTLAIGTGSLIYTISGIPSSAGTASFAISLGGQSCTLNISIVGQQPTFPSGAVHCNGIPTLVVDVTNPTTGRIWMDRNLGASRVATSSTDSLAYGDLYQWGRRADGHQCRTSTNTNTLSSTDQPAHGSFITINSGNYDWRSPQNNNLWQGVNGVNNPCPSGYRLPTETELNAERTSWSFNYASGAFASPLKLPLTGGRILSDGSLLHLGTNGFYWSSTVSTTDSRLLNFFSVNANMFSYKRAYGFSVRCIKD